MLRWGPPSLPCPHTHPPASWPPGPGRGPQPPPLPCALSPPQNTHTYTHLHLCPQHQVPSGNLPRCDLLHLIQHVINLVEAEKYLERNNRDSWGCCGRGCLNCRGPYEEQAHGCLALPLATPPLPAVWSPAPLSMSSPPIPAPPPHIRHHFIVLLCCQPRLQMLDADQRFGQLAVQAHVTRSLWVVQGGAGSVCSALPPPRSMMLVVNMAPVPPPPPISRRLLPLAP